MVLAAMGKTVRSIGASLPVRAVIFDLDGTLLDSEPSLREAFRAAATLFGRDLDDRLYAGLIGLATPDRVALLSRSFGPDFPIDAFLAEYYRQKRRRLHGIAVKPGAHALLDWLQARGIPIAVATSSSARTVSLHLARTGLDRSFAAVVTRDDVPRRKPHPDLFLHAAAVLRVAPATCLVVEDSAPGVEAGHAAGMIPVLVPDLAPVPPPTRMKSFAVLPDLYRLRAMLAGI
jgi:HAD superfamily hydrolase (TIGR01509 family)